MRDGDAGSAMRRGKKESASVTEASMSNTFMCSSGLAFGSVGRRADDDARLAAIPRHHGVRHASSPLFTASSKSVDSTSRASTFGRSLQKCSGNFPKVLNVSKCLKKLRFFQKC